MFVGFIMKALIRHPRVRMVQTAEADKDESDKTNQPMRASHVSYARYFSVSYTKFADIKIGLAKQGTVMAHDDFISRKDFSA